MPPRLIFLIPAAGAGAVALGLVAVFIVFSVEGFESLALLVGEGVIDFSDGVLGKLEDEVQVHLSAKRRGWIDGDLNDAKRVQDSLVVFDF